MQRIISEIEILEEEYAGQAPMNVLVSNMSDKYDMSEEKVDEMVRNLKHKGVIYKNQQTVISKEHNLLFYFIFFNQIG